MRHQLVDPSFKGFGYDQSLTGNSSEKATFMGLDNRDYARDRFANERGGLGGGNFRNWEVWKKLLAINLVVFLLQIFITRPATMDDLRRSPYFDPDLVSETEPTDGEWDATEPGQLTPRMLEEIRATLPPVSIVQEWFALDSEKVAHGQLWRLITSGFCHDRNSIWHLLVNMLFLFWFGSRLERRYGSKEFAAFYFASMLTASFAYIALDIYTGTLIPAIGASGAVWGVLALYALLYPYEKIYVYFLFPVEIRFLALIYFLFDLHPVLLALSGSPQHSGVAHAAHVGGVVFGFLYWKFDWRLMPMLRKWTSKMPSFSFGESNPMVLKMPHRDQRPHRPRGMESQLDAILEKLSRQGRDALTDKELEILEQTSRQLREERQRFDAADD